MKARLLYRDRDFDLRASLPWNEDALATDLELRTLFDGMAQGDEFVFAVVRTAILTGLGNDIETIQYRQDVLRDCLANAEAVREMYAITAGAVEPETDKARSSLARYPDWVLRWATTTIETFLDTLENLRRVAESHEKSFNSKGLSALLSMLKRELSAEYCVSVRSQLRQLKFSDGILLGAELGPGNRGSDYVLLEPPTNVSQELWLTRLPWLLRLIERVSGRKLEPYSFTLDPLDKGGADALTSLRNRGLALAAGALGESADHVHSFLSMLRTELAFYVGCINLHEQLTRTGAPISMPVPASPDTQNLAFEGLCDPALALTLRRRVIGNDVVADGKDLILVTGANQGGKSTFLRSVGLAQLMMQSGMFVAAESFCSSVTDRLLTHYRREEDASMESGKFDEELTRMSQIIDHVTPHAMILFNESFAATNEREGSEIARQIMSALMNRRVRMICVTHLYDLAQGFIERPEGSVLFLRAQRREDGSRTFKIIEGEALRTSFGEDLYNEIFCTEAPTGTNARKCSQRRFGTDASAK